MADSEVAEVPVPDPVPQSPPTSPVLDVEEVRAKLLAIIDANPEKNGAVPGGLDGDDKSDRCVYFLDVAGNPILDTDDAPAATPCCIVGHFVFDIPEAMQPGPFLDELRSNASIRWALREHFEYLRADRPDWTPFTITEAGARLLFDAQRFQDESVDNGKTWADIRDKIATWDKQAEEV